jgi:hypothetical protein
MTFVKNVQTKLQATDSFIPNLSVNSNTATIRLVLTLINKGKSIVVRISADAGSAMIVSEKINQMVLRL